MADRGGEMLGRRNNDNKKFQQRRKKGGNNHKGNGRKRAERKEVDAEAVVGKDEAANETRIEDLRRIGRTIRREKEDNRTKKRKKGWGTIRKG